MASVTEGTFTSVKDDASFDYFVKCGIPKDAAAKMKCTHWRNSITKVDEKFVCHLTCEEMPQFNTLAVFKEGQETDFDCVLWGGKGKASFKQLGDDSFFTTINSEKYGICEIKEKYTLEGARYHTTHKNSGAVLEEFWPREIKEEGWFRMESQENVDNFMKATGFPGNMEDYHFRMSKCGNVYRLTEVVGGVTNSYTFKLDEEFDFSFPGTPSSDRKVLFTKMDMGKYKVFSKGKSGQKEEWELKFCSLGAMWTGVDKVSGQSCKIKCKPFVNICGEFKLLAQSGGEDYFAAVGVPEEMASKMANDYDGKLTITEKAGIYHTVVESKYMPMDVCSKLDEEYTITYPGIPGTYKCVDTLYGNILMNISKGPKFTAKAKCIFTDNYLIQTSYICGTSIGYKSIFERVN